jgi:hypothetical protein
MTDPDEARVITAIEAASEAFWTTFAAQFPEIRTGEFDPLTTEHFETAVDRAAREWLSLNRPGATAF